MEQVDPVVWDLQTSRFRAMSAEPKLQLADELIALARELKASSLRTRFPELSEEELGDRSRRRNRLRRTQADIYLAGRDPLDEWGLAHRREEPRSRISSGPGSRPRMERGRLDGILAQRLSASSAELIRVGGGSGPGPGESEFGALPDVRNDRTG